jgi:hypothetical protein
MSKKRDLENTIIELFESDNIHAMDFCNHNISTGNPPEDVVQFWLASFLRSAVVAKIDRDTFSGDDIIILIGHLIDTTTDIDYKYIATQLKIGKK